MKRAELNEKISLYIDNELNDIDEKEFELNLYKDETLRQNYKQMLSIIKELKNFEEEELPTDYNKTLKSKLNNVNPKQKNNRKFNWKVLSAIAATLLVMVFSISIFSNFSIKNMESDYSQQENSTAMPEADYGETNSGSKSKGIQKFDIQQDVESIDERQKNIDLSNRGVKRKVIKQGHIRLDVENYENTYKQIVNFVKNNNGYIENSHTYNRNIAQINKERVLKGGHFKIRVPSNRIDDTLDFFTNLGKVKSKKLSGEDVTERYFDVENNVKNLRIQEERLREILKKAEKIEDILRIENELRRIRTEIDQNTGMLRKWDSLVSLATIDVDIDEVQTVHKSIKPIKNNVWKKSKEGFISSVNRIIEFIEKLFIRSITVLPIILLTVIIIGIAYILVRKIRRKKEEKYD